jgi:hypothetical protein
MILKEYLILSRPRGGRVEGRTVLIQVASGLGYSVLRPG